MHKNEDVTEKETIRIPSVDHVCMDGIKTEYTKGGPGKRQLKGKTICRIAAAGLTGVILTLHTGGAAYACPGPDCTPRQTAVYTQSPISTQTVWWGSDDKDQEKDEDSQQDGTSKDRQKSEWNEKEVLKRWDLDGDDFPEEEDSDEETTPEELTPYFEEAVSEAVAWYDGHTPPSGNLVIYSERAKAILKAASRLAVKSADKESDRLLSACGTFFENAGSPFSVSLVGALQAGVYSKGTGANERAVEVKESLQAASEKIYSTKKDSETGSDDDSGKDSAMESFLQNRKEEEDNKTSEQEDSGSEEQFSRDEFSEDELSEDEISEEDLSEKEISQKEISDEEYSKEENSQSKKSSKRSPADIRIPLRYPAASINSLDSFSDDRKTVFIGDSRTVGMEMYCGGNPDDYWSAKNSMGYSWMVSTGIPNVEYLIDENTDVVILMGVNDLGNVYQYIDYINQKAAEWKRLGARTFFVSVTPVDDGRSPNAKNSRIESFNTYAQENLKDVYYIDAYSRIRYTFGSPDGIHFDGNTYRDIYQIIQFYLYRGWYEQAGLWFYFDCGKPLTGWKYVDGQWQYMDGYGVRWVKNGRVGNLCCLPLPDVDGSQEKVLLPLF